ncbi:hypothetical protein GUJ93_ZPchr0006g41013 [Zizania palustris]|uniref:Uncharacterized protein n=1 Tax=Zizania palustris TaxID=103762 RepID=A0A8J5T636_ZIZPA|nr:hypothetical protein GUJ93_ZPchr0006g41013 [Zizania palustris]
MAAAAMVMLLFLACALDRAWTPAGAARTMMPQRGEVAAVVVVNAGGRRGGNDDDDEQLQWSQGFAIVGRRPRLAAQFTRSEDDTVAPPSSQVGGQQDGAKREVPGGSDPIHHGSKPPSSAAP